LYERYSSERLLDRRRWVAEYVKENKEYLILDGYLQEVRHFNYANPEGSEPPYHRIGELYFEDVEQMQTSLSSDEGQGRHASCIPLEERGRSRVVYGHRKVCRTFEREHAVPVGCGWHLGTPALVPLHLNLHLYLTFSYDYLDPHRKVPKTPRTLV
jgi:hypothetical protein